MSIRMQYENDSAGVVITITGSLSGAALVRGTEDLHEDEAARRLCYQILDLTGVEHIDLSIKHLEKTAELDREMAQRRDGMLIAVVVRNPVLQALCETWMSYSEDEFLRAKICATVQQAREWTAREMKERDAAQSATENNRSEV